MNLFKITAILLLSATLLFSQPTAKYPSAVAGWGDVLYASSGYSTLTASISASATSISVGSGTPFVNNSAVLIDSEVIKICNVSGTTLTVCTSGRGYSGTTAAIHSSGTMIQNVVSTTHHNNLAAEVIAIETELGSGLSGVATKARQSLSATSPLSYDNSTGVFSCPTCGSGGGSGTVTSVALTMPSGFSVSGSPITTNGTIAITTALSGLIKGSAGAFSAASAGTDYENPLTFNSPLSRTTNTISIPVATNSVSGYLSSTDWVTFNGKANASHTHVQGDITNLSTDLSAKVGGASNLTTAGRMVTVSGAGAVTEQSAVTVSGGVVTATGFSGPLTGNASTASSASALSAQYIDWTSSSGGNSIANKPSTFDPSGHNTSHKNGGSDEIATATAAANAIPKAGSGGTLDAGWIPTLNQNTTGTAAGLTSQYIDWNSSSGGSSIANKPTIPTIASTSSILKGNGSGGAVAATSGTDYPRNLVDSSIGAFVPGDYTGVFGGTASQTTTNDTTLGTAVYSFRQSSGSATRAALVKSITGNWKIKALVRVDLGSSDGSHGGIYVTVGTGTPSKYAYFVIQQVNGNTDHEFVLYSTDGSWTTTATTTGGRALAPLFSNKGYSPLICLHLSNSSGTMTAGYSFDCSDSNVRTVGTRAWGDTTLNYGGLGFYDAYTTGPKHIFVQGISIQ